MATESDSVTNNEALHRDLLRHTLASWRFILLFSVPPMVWAIVVAQSGGYVRLLRCCAPLSGLAAGVCGLMLATFRCSMRRTTRRPEWHSTLSGSATG